MNELCDIYFNVQIFSYIISLFCSEQLRMSDKRPPVRKYHVAIYRHEIQREAHTGRTDSFEQ